MAFTVGLPTGRTALISLIFTRSGRCTPIVTSTASLVLSIFNKRMNASELWCSASATARKAALVQSEPCPSCAGAELQNDARLASLGHGSPPHWMSRLTMAQASAISVLAVPASS
jgi:hypothetical protein